MKSQGASNSEIDRLGERLRKEVSDDDRRALDAFRIGFASSYETILKIVRRKSQVEVSGRPAKSTTAIVEKLKRESIRLSQMQDISGCRIVVRDVASQDTIAAALRSEFVSAVVFDRREKSSYGYRAVHIIVLSDGRAVEIQIRTELQHFWAELSEKLADRVGNAVKYGGGSSTIRLQLSLISAAIADLEKMRNPVEQDPAINFAIDEHEAHIRRMGLQLLQALENDNDFLD